MFITVQCRAVTTDIFWDVFASAYEGTFIVQENQRAMPSILGIRDGRPAITASERP